MWLKSHQYIDIPTFRTERKKTLDIIRTPSYNVLVNIYGDRYYNVETGKFITDKLNTLNSQSLLDLIDDDNENSHLNYFRHQASFKHKERYTRKSINQKWFTPRDNDFDDECKNDKPKVEKPTKPDVILKTEFFPKISRSSHDIPKREHREMYEKPKNKTNIIKPIEKRKDELKKLKDFLEYYDDSETELKNGHPDLIDDEIVMCSYVLEDIPTLVPYMGRLVDKKHFRTFIYDEKGNQLLAKSWDEYIYFKSTGFWFDEKPK